MKNILFCALILSALLIGCKNESAEEYYDAKIGVGDSKPLNGGGSRTIVTVAPKDGNGFDLSFLIGGGVVSDIDHWSVFATQKFMCETAKNIVFGEIIGQIRCGIPNATGNGFEVPIGQPLPAYSDIKRGDNLVLQIWRSDFDVKYFRIYIDPSDLTLND